MPVLAGLQPLGGSAASDLGFGGGLLRDQATDETEEEKRRRRLGLAPLQRGGAAEALFGYGQTGVASVMGLGVPSARR